MDATLLPEPAELNGRARDDHPSETSGSQFPSQKTFATARAEYALRGHALNASSRGADSKESWVLSRWGHARSFDSWPSVLEFLAQIGGPR